MEAASERLPMRQGGLANLEASAVLQGAFFGSQRFKSAVSDVQLVLHSTWAKPESICGWVVVQVASVAWGLRGFGSFGHELQGLDSLRELGVCGLVGLV